MLFACLWDAAVAAITFEVVLWALLTPYALFRVKPEGVLTVPIKRAISSSNSGEG